MRDNSKLKFETLQLHAGQEKPDSATDARCVPIYQTSSYVFPSAKTAEARFNLEDDGNIYSRIMNPTTDVFEKRMAALEGGVGALATASGAAAITYSILNIAYAGDHIVAASTIYGGTYNLLQNTLADYGITATFVDPGEPENIQNAIRSNTKAVLIESLGNPSSSVADMEAIAHIAQKNSIPLIVDSTFATPYLMRPFDHGASVVVHSATKFIGGHGTTIGGVIVDGGNFDWHCSDKFTKLTTPDPSYHGLVFTEVAGKAAYIARARCILLRDTGATLAPFNAFLLLQGLETLSLRLERHVENSNAIVKYLKKHPKVEQVNHPSINSKKLFDRYFPKGGASIFTFNIKGGANEAKNFIDNLEVFSHLANVADAKSLVIHPATTTHGQMNEQELKACGIAQNTIRLSVGIEHIDDLISDLEQAFERI